MKQPSPALIIEPKEDATAAVIWLHGLGADGHDFEGLLPHLALDDLPIRFIFPHAPHQAITVNNGMVMRAWYDITGMEINRQEDSTGILRSSALMNTWIAHQCEALQQPRQRIILAGFSQGGAITLHCGCRQSEPLGGLLALSTYLPLAATLTAESTAAALTTPILMAHGSEDPIVPLHLAQASATLLRDHHFKVDFHHYPMGHSLCDAEIGLISRWIRHSLAPTSEK
ncbi:MAG: dienelactone hydrolase family protein [Gammaproteobacteria bacterium]|nr:dienelactone hydrolase family protein [Gammaproteobacteria bacterium]